MGPGDGVTEMKVLLGTNLELAYVNVQQVTYG